MASLRRFVTTPTFVVSSQHGVERRLVKAYNWLAPAPLWPLLHWLAASARKKGSFEAFFRPEVCQASRENAPTHRALVRLFL